MSRYLRHSMALVISGKHLLTLHRKLVNRPADAISMIAPIAIIGGVVWLGTR
jgi:hypothetical protein